MLIAFEDIAKDQTFVGGKAYALAQLMQAGFPVPPGAVCTQLPQSDSEWQEIYTFWQRSGQTPLAVRSSAVGEDSQEYSHAGQNSSFLNVTGEAQLKHAVEACFASLHRQASRSYRHFFNPKSHSAPQMAVVLQTMVKPQFSGVYFSQDPRPGKPEGAWLIEAVSGLGEQLVSGAVTPYRFGPNGVEGVPLPGWQTSFNAELVQQGNKVRDSLGYEIDMEWAIDADGTFWLLQARPITAIAGPSHCRKQLTKELDRLCSSHPENPVWDGKTFAEWTGFPSYLTFSIWKAAFAPDQSFSKALTILGYDSFPQGLHDKKATLLERVFGRAYINLNKLEPLYFSHIPYSLRPYPRPHLKFDWRKVTPLSILRTPRSIYRMARVGWQLTTKRRSWLEAARKELTKYNASGHRAIEPNLYADWPTEDIAARFGKVSQRFAAQDLIWPFVLIILTEATVQSLLALLKGIMGEKKRSKLSMTGWVAV